jgi:CRP-like cAMP-binding protein
MVLPHVKRLAVRSHNLAISQVERVIALRTLPAFQELSAAELTVIAERATPRFFPKGATLSRSGAPLRSVHFIIEGSVGVRRKERAPRVVAAQDVVGALAVLTADPEGEHVIAREDTATLELEREDLEDIFDDNFPIFLGVLRALARTEIALRRRFGKSAGYIAPKSAEPAREIVNLELLERIFFLRQPMSFAKRRIEALADLALEAQELDVRSGVELWRAGGVADHSVMLMSGLVECTTDDGKQRFVLGPSAIVGGLDSVAGAKRWYTATTATHVRGLRVDSQVLLDVIEDNMEMAGDMLRVFASAIDDLEGRLEAAEL